MGMDKPQDGAPGTVDQSPRWEGPQDTRPAGYLPAKDDPQQTPDAIDEPNAPPQDDPDWREPGTARRPEGRP